MTVLRFAGLISSLLAVGLGRTAPAVAAPQDVALADRAPRFLYAMGAAEAPRPIEVDRVPVLRQKISLRLRRATLAEALAEVSRQTGLRFVYTKDVVRGTARIDLRADAITVAAALTEMLLNERVDVLFSSARQAALVARAASGVVPWRDSVPVSGTVAARESGAAIAGANVRLELQDKALQTVTDARGEFVFPAVPVGTHAVTVRYIGYRSLTRKIAVDTVAVRADFVLEAMAVSLNELVTTATGQQRRRDLGNAITTIHADSVLKSAPIRNLTDLLTNRVPGLTTRHTTGAPGDPARLRLRGLGSALRSNDPVVFVDGVRVYAAQAEARSGNLTNLLGGPTEGAAGTPAPSPLDQIDPNIIETIEVFKGPSAATLYGADAANGVIVITTKRGKPGPTRWTASVMHGRTTQPGRWPTGYYRWGHDVFSSGSRFCPLVDVRCVADSLVQFQALNEPSLTLLGQGRTTTASLTASGGTPALTYSVTGSYGDETGLLRLPAFEVARFREMFQREAPDWMRRPHRYKEWSVSSNVMARLGATADVTLASTLSRSEQQRTSLEDQLTALRATYIDTLNGRYYQNGRVGALETTDTILNNYYQQTTASTLTFTTGLNTEWRPRPWFTASGQAGLNVVPRDDQTLLRGGLLGLTDSGSLTRGSGRSLVSTFNVQGALRKPLGRGFVFRTSLGANVTSTATSDLASSARIPPGSSGLVGASRFRATGDRASTSVFGWYVEPTIAGERLSLSTGLRLDGGSAYGTRISGLGGGGGGFLKGLLALPKLNGSWVVSEEPWFPFGALFSSLRLRGGYGQAQVQPGAADRLRLYDQKVRLTTLGNTRLRPERSTELEGGFDADLFDSRVTLELTAYRKLTVDALMSLRVPTSVNGGGSVLTNIGNIKNTGLELVVGLTPLRSSLLTWNTQLIYSRNANTLLQLGRGVAENRPEGLVEGYPVGSRWELPILGFTDPDGDGVLQRGDIQVGDTLVYMGRLQPAYTMGLHTNVALFGGAVGLTASLSYDAGATQINGPLQTQTVLSRALVDPSAPLIEQAALLAYQPHQPDGSPVLSRATAYGVMEEVSTLRFQSLAVNYVAPDRVARFLRAERLTVALQGANLGLHSSYRGQDPDVNTWGPGERISDGGQLPQPRTWQLALYLEY